MSSRTVPGPPTVVARARDEPALDVSGLLSDVLRDQLGPAGGPVVVLALSKDENPKATVLVLAGPDRTPNLVVKIALTRAASPAVLREADALRRLESLDRGRLGQTIPSLVEVRQVDGRAVMVTTACAGVPMSSRYHRWRHTGSPDRVCADFACAAAWLDRLARLPNPLDQSASTGQARQAPGDPWQRDLDLPSMILRRWRGDPVAVSVARHADRVRESLRADRTGLVHGDFWCGNVLSRAGRVTGVIDWEQACLASDPLRDRVRFALGYSLYLDRHTVPGRAVFGHAGLVAGRWGEPLRYVIRGGGWFPGLVAGFIGDGLARTGRPHAAWRDALVLGLVEVAAVSDHADFARHHLDLAAEIWADA